MAPIILDSGALIAIERGDRRMGALLHATAHQGVDAITSSTCVAETWREPARQARLARALSGIVDRPLDPVTARRCGVLLLARTGTTSRTRPLRSSQATATWSSQATQTTSNALLKPPAAVHRSVASNMTITRVLVAPSACSCGAPPHVPAP